MAKLMTVTTSDGNNRSGDGHAEGTRRRILIIDHDADARARLADHLALLGFEVAGADSGPDGLARLADASRAAPFHGVLIEMHLPQLGGLAVLKETCARFPGMPVMVMSDAAHLVALRDAVNQGAREYVLKPFDAELVRRKCLSIFAQDCHPAA